MTCTEADKTVLEALTEVPQHVLKTWETDRHIDVRNLAKAELARREAAK